MRTNERRTTGRGFTIIELLVVVSVIALLISILLPAVGKARQQALETISNSNLRNLGVAHAMYAAQHNDRQVTFVADSIGNYGTNACTAFNRYNEDWVNGHPNLVLGWGPDKSGPGGETILWEYHLDGTSSGHHCWAGNPINFTGSADGFGQFRFGFQTRSFSPFLSGRYYDPVFFAPKDRLLYEIVEIGFGAPAQFASIPADDGTSGSVLYTSSYCMSPAAMYSPDTFAYNADEDSDWVDPWDLAAGLRSPAMSQALYPTLKTHMLEHNWLQAPALPCNPHLETPSFAACVPYFFKHGWESRPVTLFFDGHVQPVGVREAERSDGRVMTQAGHGLWSRKTPFGEDGYFSDFAYDQSTTSFHILTTDGIRGRDIAN